jgi:hypothetical protein
VRELVKSHEVDPEELGGEADVLGVLDPTDMLARRISRPKGLAWIDSGLSDDNFNRFADLNELKAGRVEPLCCGLAAWENGLPRRRDAEEEERQNKAGERRGGRGNWCYPG